MSSWISLLSGFGDAIGRPFRVVVLYLSPRPRTIICPADAIDIPDIFFTPSATFEIPFVLISFAPRFSIATLDFCLSIISARSPSRFFFATTVTSSSCWLSVFSAITVSPFTLLSTVILRVSYATYWIISTSLSATSLISNFPSMSVTAPVVVPSICTVAPISGSPVALSIITPLKSMACAVTAAISRGDASISFLMSFILFYPFVSVGKIMAAVLPGCFHPFIIRLRIGYNIITLLSGDKQESPAEYLSQPAILMSI